MVNTTKIGKKILIVGSGGREHALGWKLAQSSNVAKLFFAPGNGGTASLGRNVKILASNVSGLLRFAKKNDIDLTIVGPEQPLSLGIVDKFTRSKLSIFGPSKKAARLESSKAWCANFLDRHNIPAAGFKVFSSYKQAAKFIQNCPWTELVVKADGLAAGKGVLLPQTKDEAIREITDMIKSGKLGKAGRKVLIQERLYGTELSVIALCDGKDIKILLPAQDHKAVNDDDKGPNTGGMGAYTPVTLASKELIKQIKSQILLPTVDGMAKEGNRFVGVLYAGLMLTCDGPKVLEYNVRFGDPETQVQLMMMKSDLLNHLEACIKGSLKNKKVVFHKGYGVTVVLASKGYPGFYTKGQLIHGLEEKMPENVVVFHAGTKLSKDAHFSVGGRVLGVTVRAETLKKALMSAYDVIDSKLVYFKSMHYRRDIGKKDLIKKKLELVILISGSGTSMESIIRATLNGVLAEVEVVGVISSEKEAGGIKKAKKLGVKTYIVNPYSSNFESELLVLLTSLKPDLVSQNGWLPLTPRKVIKKYKGKIINQHPAPLDPEHRGIDNYDFGGECMYGLVPHEAIIRFGKLVHKRQPVGYAKRYIPTEATVHLVTDNFDEGDVIAREELVINDSDTAEVLQARLLPIEHRNVINAIKDIACGRMTIKKRAKPFVRKSEREILLRAKKEATKKYHSNS